MKRKIVNILLVLLILTGIGLMAYPFVSNIIHEKQQDKIILETKQEIDNMEDDTIKDMLETAYAYNEKIKNTVVLSDPFGNQVENTTISDYYDILNVNSSGLIGYIEIPRLDLYETIYHGTSETVLSKGVGHLPLSSLPVGGEGTHSVLSAHTGLPQAELFTNLPEMREGDIFYIHILGETLAYEVDQIKTVEPHEIEELQIVEGEDYVTLVTCTPYGLNTHRYLVRGKRTEYNLDVMKAASEQKEEGIEKEQWSEHYLEALIKGLVIGLAIIIIIVLLRKFIKWRKVKRMQKREAKERKKQAALEAKRLEEAKSGIEFVNGPSDGIIPETKEEPAATEKSVATEQSVTEEPVAVEEPLVAEETTVEEKFVVAEEPAAIEESVAVEEPAAIEESVAVEEPSATEESVVAEELTAIEQSATIEEELVTEEPVTIEQSATIEEEPVTGESAAIEEPVTIEDESATEEPEAIEPSATVEKPEKVEAEAGLKIAFDEAVRKLKSNLEPGAVERAKENAKENATISATQLNEEERKSLYEVFSDNKNDKKTEAIAKGVATGAAIATVLLTGYKLLRGKNGSGKDRV